MTNCANCGSTPAKCKTCAKGYTLSSAGVCSKCSVSSNGCLSCYGDVCSSCPVNTYVVTSGASSCTSCA